MHGSSARTSRGQERATAERPDEQLEKPAIDNPLHSLAYVSRSRLDGDAETIRGEIERILACSRSHNERHDITGLLMFDDVCFAQILEGSRLAVEQTFERVRVDPRHGDVVLLTNEPLDARAFGDWSMACVEGKAGLLAEFLACRASDALTGTAPPCEPLLAEVEYLAGRVGRAGAVSLLGASGNFRPAG